MMSLPPPTTNSTLALILTTFYKSTTTTTTTFTSELVGASKKKAILVDSLEEKEYFAKRIAAICERCAKFQPVLDVITEHNLDIDELIEYCQQGSQSQCDC